MFMSARNRLTHWQPTLVALASLTMSLACGRPDPGARSPTLDYPPPPPETANGDVVGADRTAPADKLKTGPRVGDDGVRPAGRPGEIERGTPTDDICKHLSPSDAKWKEKCVTDRAPPKGP